MNNYPHLSKLANAGETLSKFKKIMGGDAKAPIGAVTGGETPTTTSENTKKMKPEQPQPPAQPAAPAAPPQPQPKEATAMHEAGHDDKKKGNENKDDSMRVVGTAPEVKTVPHEATGEQAWKDMQDKIAAAYPALAKAAANPAAIAKGLSKGWKGLKGFVGLGDEAADAAKIKISPEEVAAATPAAGSAAATTQLPKIRISPEEAFPHNWSSRAGKYVPSQREIPGHGSTPPGPQVRITPDDIRNAAPPQQAGGKVTVSPDELYPAGKLDVVNVPAEVKPYNLPWAGTRPLKATDQPNPANFFPKSSAYPALAKQAEIDWDNLLENAKTIGLLGVGGAGLGSVINLFKGKDISRGAITGGLTGAGYGAGRRLYDAFQPDKSWYEYANPFSPIDTTMNILQGVTSPLVRGAAGVGGGALGYQLAQGLQGEEEDEDEKEKQLRALAKMSSAYPALTKQAAGLGTIAKDVGISTLTGSGLGALLNLIRGKDVIPGAVTGGLTLGGMNLGSHGGDALGGTLGGLAGMAGGGVGGYQLAQLLNDPEIMSAIKEKGGDVADWFSGDEEEPEKYAEYTPMSGGPYRPKPGPHLPTLPYRPKPMPSPPGNGGPYRPKPGPHLPTLPYRPPSELSRQLGGGGVGEGSIKALRQALQGPAQPKLGLPSNIFNVPSSNDVREGLGGGALGDAYYKHITQGLMKQNMAMYPTLTKQAFEMPEGISDAWSGIKDYLGKNPKALNAILGGVLGAGIGGFAGGGKGALGGLLAGGGAGYVSDDVSKYVGDYLAADKTPKPGFWRDAWDTGKWTLPPYWAYRAFT